MKVICPNQLCVNMIRYEMGFSRVQVIAALLAASCILSASAALADSKTQTSLDEYEVSVVSIGQQLAISASRLSLTLSPLLTLTCICLPKAGGRCPQAFGWEPSLGRRW